MTRRFKSSIRKASLLFVLLAGALTVAEAQSSQYDKGTPPQHAVGVSSLGSYASTELGTINLANGALNFKIPLGSIGGRGMTMPLTLNYSSKVWSASMDVDTERESSTDQPVAYADFDMGLLQGSDLYRMIGAGWSIAAGPRLEVKIVRIGLITSGSNIGCHGYRLAKLTLYLPDRGEVEFRDDATDGAPLARNCSTGEILSRGTRWHATDGSGMIFINDVDNGVANETTPNLSGTVITADGTRINFGSSGVITDRNGNKISGDGAGGFVDQLGRTTTIQHNVADPEYPYGTLAVLVTIPGYQGPRYYKIKTGIMNQNYRAGINPSLPVINGDWDPEGYNYDEWWGSPTKLFAKSYGLYAQQIDNREVLTEVVLPDGRWLKFKYNQFGEVAEVELPTGGKIQYDYGYSSQIPTGNSPTWETGTNGAGSGIVTDVKFVDRAVTAKRTYPDGSTLEGQWGFAFGSSSSVVTGYSSTNTLLSDVRHYFLTAGRYTEDYDSQSSHDGTHYNLWSTGIEYRTEVRDGSGNIISASEQDWTQRAPVSWSGYAQEQPANDNRVNEARKILDDSNTAKVQTFYQSSVNYNNPVEVKEYDFDNSLKRRTTTTYADSSNLINNTNYTADSIHLLSLPLTQTVYNVSNNQVAKTDYEYDNYTNDGNRAPLQDYGTVIGHDSSYGGSYLTRGNVTRSGVWLNVIDSFVYSYPRYDDLGNVISAKDPKGNVSNISFADDFGNGSSPGTGASGTFGATYALPTLITSPPPTPGAPVQTARSQYDFSTGLLTGFKDRNGVISQTFYNDPFNRPTLVKAALGITGVEAHSAMYYAPGTAFGISLTNNDVLSTTDQTTIDDAALRSWTKTDGFGRTIESWSRDPQGDDKVLTMYDALGRAYKQSNPFRPSLSETPIYTTTAFDFAGRVTSVTTPDSAVVTTSYLANTVTVSDQLGKSRKSVTDGLGRLIQVYEDPSGLNYLTSYSYDTLDNLITVSQGSQTRSFAYDSLKRLTSAMNPESGTITYAYDENGNLTIKTDARPITTTYEYDALNRVKTRTYNDGTPAVSYAYDTVAQNGKGRLASVSSSVSSYSYSGYDALGRVLGGTQTIENQSYSISNIVYDLAGHLKTMTYPSGRTIAYDYDSAGRTNSFTGYLGDGTNRNYSTGISYDAGSRMTQEQFGTATPIYNKLFYNSRGQLSEIREGLTPNDGSWQRGAIINHYSGGCWGMCGGLGMPDNNGNLKQQDHWIQDDNGNVTAIFTQQYDYDSLNRLQRVHHDAYWQQQYSYDRYGNRTIDQANTFGTGIPEPNFGVDAATNRLTAPAGYTMSYDSAGNLSNDTFTGEGQRTFDAENRMKQAWANNQWQTYSYDGDGRRVRRIVGTTETWQVYGLGGELLAEYSATNPSPASPQKEYGYRNGQLLVTAEVTAGSGGSAFSFVDDPLVVATTIVKAVHLTELRTAVNQARAHANLSAASWAESISSEVTIKASHVTELRTRLDEARQALGLSAASYTDPSLTYGYEIKAAHMQELRIKTNEALTAGGSAGVDIRWLVSDQLGTPRMIFDQSGSLATVSRHDYLPFGEELFSGTGGRTTAQGYTNNDGARQKFTLKERDIETGLDYFVNRYYSSSQGRFTSVDPIKLTPARILQPQRLNLYSYTINNPLNLIDPDGKDIDFVNDTKEGRRKALLSITANMTAREAKNVGMRWNKDTQKYEGYIKDASKIDMGKASQGYQDFADRVGNHDLKLNYAFIGKSDSVTIEMNGVTTKVTQKSLAGAGGDSTGFVAPQSDGSFAVIVSAAGQPSGVAGLTASGRETTIAMPNFIMAAHELFAETYKYTPAGRRQGLDREENVVDDSNKVIEIENKYRDFHGLPRRSGTDHGYIHAGTVTVRP